MSHSHDTLPRMHSQPILRPLSGMKRKSWDVTRAVSSPQPPPIKDDQILDVRAFTPPPTLPHIHTGPLISPRPSVDTRPSFDTRPSIDGRPSIDSANITRVVDLSSANITFDRGRLGDLARELGQVIADTTTISLLQALETGSVSTLDEFAFQSPPTDPLARGQNSLREIKSSVDRMKTIVNRGKSQLSI